MTDRLVKEIEGHLPHIPLEIVSQGAEALVFQTSTHPYIDDPYLKNQKKYIVKFRPSKPYRHPIIDASINKTRTIGEAKFMTKLNKLGINSPSIISVDYSKAIIWMEFLGSELTNGDISSFKNWLWYLERNESEAKCVDEQVEQVCKKVGELIGKLHMNDMIHGDLTSSNIILQDFEPALIDFGLSSYSGLAEDKAVDLYVLERAILSTHSVFSDTYNGWLLEGYGSIHKQYSKQGGTKKYAETIKKLEDVRLRGRKRSMLG
ncbi:kinase-like domain-containing protein [Scheffersomyces coipomensis]|uniref:kinase-like domain-containing protein n=1 Tax=Scheffersomyces coipomensis TaxID=1788519 RepID=UPI00315CCBC7